jgi:hypothetical protein
MNFNNLSSELSSSLNEMRSKLNQLKSDLHEESEKENTKKIINYCDYVRSDIQLITESVCDQIQKFSDLLLDEVDAYERDCIQVYKDTFNKKQSQSSKKFIQEVTKWQNDVEISLETKKDDDVSLTEMASSLEKTKNYKKKLNNQLLQMKRDQFNNRLIKFKQNLSPISIDILGSLHFEKIGKIFLKKKFFK